MPFQTFPNHFGKVLATKITTFPTFSACSKKCVYEKVFFNTLRTHPDRFLNSGRAELAQHRIKWCYVNVLDILPRKSEKQNTNLNNYSSLSIILALNPGSPPLQLHNKFMQHWQVRTFNKNTRSVPALFERKELKRKKPEQRRRQVRK